MDKKIKNNIVVLLKDGGLYIITEEQISLWQLLYPKLDVENELELLKELWSTNAIPRKTSKNINKFINKTLADLNS